MNKTADTVVIGGGVMGLSIALELAQRGVGGVLLLDKAFLGAGSSGKSGAVVRCHYSQPLLVQMARFGLEEYRRFPETVGGPRVFTEAGLVVVTSREEQRQLDAHLAMQRDLGVQTGRISAEELRSIDPHVVLRDDEIVAYEAEAGYCESLQVIASLAAAARRAGVTIEEGVEVVDIPTRAGRVAGVVTKSGEVASEKVMLAAGPWSAPLAKRAGVELPVQPGRTQVGLVRRPAEFGKPHPVYADFTNQMYFKPLPGELTHVGNIDPREERAVVDPDDYPEVADEAFAREMRGKLCRRYGLLRRSVGRGGYAALYSVAPDWNPILGRLPGVEGAFCAVGFSGHGFKLAPAVGKVMAELVLDGEVRRFDIGPLRAGRFAEGDLFSGKTAAKVMG